MSLQVTRDDLLREVGRFLGWNRNPSQWDTRQTTDAQDILRRGVAAFYYPSVLPGEGRAHVWSFLTPVLTIVTEVNGEDYDLPEDFGGMTADLHYASEDSHPHVRKVPVDAILRLRQQDVNSAGFPARYAITPGAGGGQTKQLWTLMLHPKAQDVYTLRGRYRSDPLAITGSAQYPLGGQVSADALTASCVAAADQVINDNYLSGTWMTFLDKLRTAVYIDRQENFAGNLGYNGDGDSGVLAMHDSDTFTINGVSYGSAEPYFSG